MDLGRYLMLRLQGASIDTKIFRKKNAPSPPPPPDPQVQIQAQAEADRYDINSPLGTVKWEQGPDGRWTQNSAFSGREQKLYNTRTDVANALLGKLPRTPVDFGEMDPTAREALDRISAGSPGIREKLGEFNPQNRDLGGFNVDVGDASKRLAGRMEDFSTQKFTPSVDGAAVRDAFFKKQKLLLDPHFDREEVRLDDKLANQGLPMGGEAFKDDYGDFAHSRDQSYERAALDAILAGSDEEQRQFGRQLSTRQQQYGEIADALSGARGVEGDTFGRDLATRAQLAGEAEAGFGRDVTTRQVQTGEFESDEARRLAADQTAFTGGLALDEAERGRQLQERNQLYNEIAALLGGQQQVSGAPGGGTDVGGAFANYQAGLNRQHQSDLAEHSADTSRTNTGIAAAAAIAAAMI